MGFISPIPTDSNGQVKTTGALQQLGKDDFLQLLITQLENQDPMEPMSNEESIAQLAQFSSLEQMNNIAAGIAESNELDYLQMQSLNNVMASGLVGKDAKADYSGIYFEPGADAPINYTLKSSVDTVTFQIRSSDGTLVRTLTQDNMKEGVNTVVWDGTDQSGNRVDLGYYYISAQAKLNDGTTFTPQLSLAGSVETVVYREGSAFVQINGTQVPLGAITEIGEPGAFSTSDAVFDDGSEG